MKQFQFIIPICLMLLFFCCLNLPVFGDEHRYGCWLQDTNYIWHTTDPAHPGSTNFLNDGVTGALNGDDDGYYEKDGRCPDVGVICKVYWQASTLHPAAEERGAGLLADFSVDNCPIDGEL